MALQGPKPWEIVHHVAYASGLQFLCDMPWVVALTPWVVSITTYHACAPVGRTTTISRTPDPVDCMKCLVLHGRL